MTRMTGAQAFFEVAVSEGTEYIFGNPGTTQFPILDGIKAYPPMKYILGLHENVAIAMANGYARASGKIGVVNVHATEGVCNTMAELYNAFYGGSRIVLVIGTIETKASIREGAWCGDMVQMTRQFTKWGIEVKCAANIPTVMRRAFKVAAQPPTGPVLVSIPVDFLENSEEMEIPPASQLFPRSRPDSEAIAKAATLLANSANPAIYVGDRVAQSGAVAEAVTLAETLGAKVYAARMTELNFPMNHALFMGINQFGDATTSELLQGVDVMLIVGANLGTHAFEHGEAPYPSTTKVIHIDINPWEIAKSYPVEIGITADCKAGLRDLIDSVCDIMSAAQRKAAYDRVAAIAQEKARMRDNAERRAKASWDNVPISLPRLMIELREAIKPGTVIIGEAMSSRFALYEYLEPSEPGSFFYTQRYVLGSALPGALGIKLALQDRPVVAVVGDGAAMYSIQALWSAAHYRIPVTYIICNNSGYHVLGANWKARRGLEPEPEWLNSYVRFGSPALNYAKIAEDFGLHGRRVERPEELASVLKEALQSEGPAVVDVVVKAVS